MKVQVQVADFIDFGPQLQTAKSLVDECLNEWSADSRPEIRAVVTRAFNTDKEGQINRSDIFMLLRLDIDDGRWRQAMEAIRDAMRVIGSKEYVRFYQRRSIEDALAAGHHRPRPRLTRATLFDWPLHKQRDAVEARRAALAAEIGRTKPYSERRAMLTERLRQSTIEALKLELAL